MAWEYPMVAYQTVCEDCHHKPIRPDCELKWWEAAVELSENMLPYVDIVNDITRLAAKIGSTPKEVFLAFSKGLVAGQFDREDLLNWSAAYDKHAPSTPEVQS